MSLWKMFDSRMPLLSKMNCKLFLSTVDCSFLGGKRSNQLFSRKTNHANCPWHKLDHLPLSQMKGFFRPHCKAFHLPFPSFTVPQSFSPELFGSPLFQFLYVVSWLCLPASLQFQWFSYRSSEYPIHAVFTLLKVLIDKIASFSSFYEPLVQNIQC